ncbi:MAG: hypothetical protein HOV68_31570 [Streptomycetaceae bacterium]|nr:hypothetical protein [Streptomycetaceae bacterium]
MPSCVRDAVPSGGTGGTQPIAAERARFEGSAAWVLVYSGSASGTARVYIVDASCAEPPAKASASGAPTSPAASDASHVLYSTTVPLR